MKKSLTLSLIAPSGLLVEKEVEKVFLPGSEGAFEVLIDHAPLIASLNAGDIVYVSNGEEQRQTIKTGFVRVLQNKVEACIEI